MVACEDLCGLGRGLAACFTLVQSGPFTSDGLDTLASSVVADVSLDALVGLVEMVTVPSIDSLVHATSAFVTIREDDR